ncbi:MAG: hypothetical protein U0798_12805 [Gemmataceae bacterium]
MPARIGHSCYVILLFISWMILLSGFTGCSSKPLPLAAIEKAESLTLYSIDGRDYVDRDGEKTKTDETIHGYPVVGKVEIKDAEKRKAIVAALKTGLEQKDTKMAKCFWPRHAIRTVEAGKTIDYVICFECHQLELWAGERKTVFPLSDDPKPTMNKILMDANVTIVPDGKPGMEKN